MSEDVGAPSRPASGWPAFLYCLRVFLAVRVLVAVVALASVALLPDLSRLTPGVRESLGAIPGPVDVPGWPAHGVTPGWHNAVTSWERFDALWYLRIADSGYADGDGSAAFFPLYPLAVRAVSLVLGGHPLAGGLLVSNVAFLLALVVLHALTRDELGEETARSAVVFAAVFPTALFFFAPYSESLFLLFVLLSLHAARRGRWPVAAVAGALAALTRNVGLLLVLPLAIEAIHQARERGAARRAIVPLLCAVGPAVGTLAYLAFWRVFGGDWLAPLHQQAQWERVAQLPTTTAVRATEAALDYIGVYPGGYHFLDWLIALPVIAAAVYALFAFRPAFSGYAWANVIVPMCFVFTGRPLMSFPRFALVIFPAWWAFARWTRERPAARQLAVAASAALLGVLTLLFASWYYIF